MHIPQHNLKTYNIIYLHLHTFLKNVSVQPLGVVKRLLVNNFEFNNQLLDDDVLLEEHLRIILDQCSFFNLPTVKTKSVF